jgi:YD repeat-containing protein
VGALNTLGQIAYVEDQAGTVHFSYNPRGQVTGSIRQYKDEGLTFVTRKEYDALEHLTKTVFPDGSAVSYEYDGRGLLKRIPGFVDDITYTASGQRASIAYANGVQTTYAYDARQRIEQLQTTHGQTVLQDLSYGLDDVDNIVSITDGRSGKRTENDQSQTFTYDSLYRLTQSSGAYGQIDFAYDAIGNIVRKSSTVDDPRLNLGEMHYGEGVTPMMPMATWRARVTQPIFGTHATCSWAWTMVQPIRPMSMIPAASAPGRRCIRVRS